jgi:hypothetical protein
VAEGAEGAEGPSKLVLPGTPVLWMFIDRFSQFNLLSSKAQQRRGRREWRGQVS